jgi:hypothetical protein
MHAGMRATRVPGASGHRGQRPAGELPRLVITRGGQGPRPAPAGPGWLRYGHDGLWNLPAAKRSWRQRPGGALTLLLAPFAKAWCDALAGNGCRLSAIMRPLAGPAGPVTAIGRQGCIRVMLGSLAR